MDEYRVTTPVKDFSGEVAGVAFVKGEAVTSSGPALAYFRSAGYGVEHIPPHPPPVEQDPAALPDGAKVEVVKDQGDPPAEGQDAEPNPEAPEVVEDQTEEAAEPEQAEPPKRGRTRAPKEPTA